MGTRLYKMGELTEEERAAGVVSLAGRANLAGLDVFDQDQVWTNAPGEQVRLDEMEPSYRRNLLAFLERHAGRYEMHDAIAWALGPFAPQGDMASMDFDRYLDERSQNPLVWLRGTALYRRLAELVEQDRASGDPMEPGWWE